jgi:hypothetical protein
LDFPSALARNLPPRRLGPVRLRYEDSCLLLDVLPPAGERRLRSALEGAGLGAGACALLLLALPGGPGPVAAATALLLGAGLMGTAAAVRPPASAVHRCALLFDAEVLVLEFPAAAFRPARSVRVPFDAVSALHWEPAAHARGEDVVLAWEEEDGSGHEALIVRGVRGEKIRSDVEALLGRLRTMLALSEEGVRRGSPPPSRTSAPGVPPTSG